MKLCVSDSSSVTWFKPPPFETVTDPATTSEANKSLIKGSLNEKMDCNFNVTADLSLITVSMKFEGWSVATLVQSQRALLVQPGFESRFNATWVPYRLTLIFFNVTSADKGEYSCEMLTLRGRSAQIWVRKIQVSLLGKLCQIAMIIIINCVNNKILEHDWLLTALIYALIGVSGPNCRIWPVRLQTFVIGQAKSDS